jgi:hypothetical protein
LLIWQTLNQNNPANSASAIPNCDSWVVDLPGGHRAKLRAGWPAANAGRHAQRCSIGLAFENAPFTALGNPRSSTVNFEPRTVTDTAPPSRRFWKRFQAQHVPDAIRDGDRFASRKSVKSGISNPVSNPERLGFRGHRYAKEPKAKLIDQQPIARTPMQTPPVDPDVADTAPSDSVLTACDEEHLAAWWRVGLERRCQFATK